MAWSSVAQYSNSSSSGVGSITCTVGTSATANNLLLAFVGVRNGGDAFTTPTGYTLIDTNSRTNDGFAAYYRIASGTSADDCAFSWTDNGPCHAVVCEFSGNDTSSVFSESLMKTSDLGTDSTTHTTSSLTPATGNLIVPFFYVIHNLGWNTPNTSATTISSPFSFAYENTGGASGEPYIAVGYYEATDTTARAVTFTTDDAGDERASIIAEFVAASSGITGTAAPTEGADTSAASGTLTANISGTLAQTEGADTSAASGNVTGSKTGTVAVTEGADTSAASGTIQTFITGTIAATNGDDTSAGSGTVTAPNSIEGTAAIIELADTLAASGIRNTTITGTIAVTEGADFTTASAGNGYLPGLTGKETPEQLKAKRNARQRYLNVG
jgi:hypothetical protein